MKQMEHSYKGEEKFLVNDLKTIVSKARSKAFAAVNYSLVERNWRIGKRIVEEMMSPTTIRYQPKAAKPYLVT